MSRVLLFSKIEADSSWTSVSIRQASDEWDRVSSITAPTERLAESLTASTCDSKPHSSREMTSATEGDDKSSSTGVPISPR